jgi:phosphatidylglycerophosphate synthase
MTETVKKSSYRDTLKSADTEEHIDLAFYRPIGYMWACAARALGITPNVITIASIFLGVGAGIAFYYDNLWINVLGIVLLVWANSFDSADGQLARMTKQYSRLGRILDGVAGDFWFISIYFAICFRENVTSSFFSSHPWLIWIIAVVTGLCHAKQASMADYYRQFHLYFLKGEEGSELESSEKLREKYVTVSWSKNFWQKLVMCSYINYTKGQEQWTPRMQQLRAALKERFGDGVANKQFRDAFRMQSLPLMKYTNILSFNWRSIALFVAILARMPWLYFAFELIVLNTLLIYMVVRHERICTNFTKAVKNGIF